jgi:hypothetical protein
MLLRRGEVGPRIEDHLDPDHASRHRFIADGDYAKHLANWLVHFPRQQVLILIHDDIQADPSRAFDTIRRFLSLEGVAGGNLKQLVKAKELPTLPRPMRRLLAPLKPIVAPFRRHRWFSSLRSLIARPIAYPPLTDALRQKLCDYYRDDIRELENLLGRSLKWIPSESWDACNKSLAMARSQT